MQTINKGDIHKALIKLIANDELIDRLTDAIPELILFMDMLAQKIEKVIFGEADEKDGRENSDN